MPSENQNRSTNPSKDHEAMAAKSRRTKEVIAAVLLLISILLLVVTATQANRYKAVVSELQQVTDATAEPRYSAQNTTIPDNQTQ